MPDDGWVTSITSNQTPRTRQGSELNECVSVDPLDLFKNTESIVADKTWY